MKHGTRLFLVMCGVFVLTATAFTQLTITKADADAAIINKMWIYHSDSTSRTFNLGTNATGQTWDFSWINLAASTVQKDTQNYFPASGVYGFSNFPNATAASTRKETMVQGPITFTITTSSFVEIAQDGGYLLGVVLRQVMSPAFPPYPADTTYVIKIRPKSLGLPLPLTAGGGTRTSTDTILASSVSSSTEINQRTYIMAGSGTMTLPGGRQVQAIRLINDRIEVNLSNSGNSRDHHRSVMFIGADFTQLEFNVLDTNYTSGSTLLSDYDLTIPSGPAMGVEQTSSMIPDAYSLAQNYPNPFNPATTIKFDLATEGVVTLKVYNMIGQEVATLANGQYAPGSYNATFDASSLPSGMYIYRLSVNGFVQSKSMMLVK